MLIRIPGGASDEGLCCSIAITRANPTSPSVPPGCFSGGCDGTGAFSVTPDEGGEKNLVNRLARPVDAVSCS